MSFPLDRAARRTAAAFLCGGLSMAASVGCDGPSRGVPSSVSAGVSVSAGASVSAWRTSPSSVPAEQALPPQVRLSASTPSRRLATFPEQAKPITLAELPSQLPFVEGARIQLDDAGLEPLAPRRHALKQGETHKLLIEVDLGMQIDQDGTKTFPAVPALSTTVTVVTTKVADGMADLSLSIDKAVIRTRGAADLDGSVLQEVRALVEQLPGIRAAVQVNAQGVRSHTPRPPKETAVAVGQLWVSIAEAVTDAIVVFPAEPIGPGAKWTVVDRQRRAGVTMLRRTQWTLMDLTGEKLRLQGVVVEVAIAGTTQDRSLPKEMIVTVVQGMAAGKRRHSLKAGQLWPLATTTELSSDLKMQASATGPGLHDTKTSQVMLTQILRAVRSDAAADMPNEALLREVLPNGGPQ